MEGKVLLRCTIKKMHLQQKTGLEGAMRIIASRLEAGEIKLVDLIGVQVYKFSIGHLQCLLTYFFLDEKTLKLLMVGPHENYYRDL